MNKKYRLIFYSVLILLILLTGCSKSGSESLEVEPKSGEYHRVYTDSAGEPHLMKQSVRLEFKRDGFEKDSFQIGLAKASRN